MGSQSPESEPSNTASIQTNMAEKRILPEGRASEKLQEKQREDFFRVANYPNPFNPTTTIFYQLPEAVHVTVAIYDVRGRLVEILVDGEKTAGRYSVQWQAESQPSGVYFSRIQAGRFTATKRLLLLK